MQHVADNVAPGVRVGADADIVRHRHIRKQRHVLERAADADVADLVRRLGENALTFDQDVAFAGLIEPAETVEERRLARAVRTDQTQDLALAHVEGDAVQRDDAAEHDADVANGEQGLALRSLRAHAQANP
jgi:hypothetical protein